MKLYVPKDIPSEYVYVANITNTYYDLYNTNDIAGKTVDYIRVYYALDDDLYLTFRQTYSQYNTLVCKEIVQSHSIFAKHNSLQVFGITFIVCFFIIFVINIMTSIVKKGGILGK